MPRLCFQYNRFTLSTYPRVNYRNKNRSCGPVPYRLFQAVGCFPDVISWYLMGKVIQFQVGRNAIGHTLHGGYSAILQAKIRLEHHDLILCDGKVREEQE